MKTPEPELVRRCALCETMRPESRLARSGAEWSCLNLRTCARGREIRAMAQPYETVFIGWKRDHWRWRETVRDRS